ncbi:MAG TPA: ABC transporter substrate-binding protein [Tepidisphaeraceae bacterium]|nr:ABC transporter substrate-binding protein [Tepidisphaeraceae bacterium]
MKKTGKIACLLVMLLGALLGQGCDRSQSSSSSSATTPPKKNKTVAIATLMSHPALDQVSDGVKEKLKEAGYEQGKNLTLIERNANGQTQLAATIASELSASDADVIVAITTPMAQAVVKNSRVPVVFAAVTDPVGAGVVKSLKTAEEKVTGTSDAWPYEDQIKLIRELVPNAKRLGVLYNPGEAASKYGIERIRELAPKNGFEVVEAPANSTGEVYGAAAAIADKVDVLFLSSDNTVIAGVAGAVKVAVDRKIPLFVGDSGTVEKGGIGAVSVGYKQLGRDTGDLTIKTLNGERNLPVVVASGAELYLNTAAAERMGVKIPDTVLKRATKIFNTIP